mgnify:CR=1 FL=1
MDDGEEWPEVDLGPRLSDAHDENNLMHDSGLQECQLVIDTNDPRRANFAMNVGWLVGWLVNLLPVHSKGDG